MGKCPGGNPLFHWHLSLFPQLFHKAERARARSQIIHREREAIRQTLYTIRGVRAAHVQRRMKVRASGSRTTGKRRTERMNKVAVACMMVKKFKVAWRCELSTCACVCINSEAYACRRKQTSDVEVVRQQLPNYSGLLLKFTPRPCFSW